MYNFFLIPFIFSQYNNKIFSKIYILKKIKIESGFYLECKEMHIRYLYTARIKIESPLILISILNMPPKL